MPLSPPTDELFSQANAWFFRLRADDVSAVEREHFAAWLVASPAHANAWDAVQELFAQLEVPAKAVHIHATERAMETKVTTIVAKRPARWRRAWVSLAAATCIGVIGVLLEPALLQNLQSDYHTATGEQQRIELADGSKLFLNTDSAVRIAMTKDQRRVTLLRGEAFFEVAHAPQRPFWVEAGQAHARVTGTAFGVNRSADDVEIIVTEGRVETSGVSHNPQILSLKPGEAAHYRGAQFSAKQSVDAQRELAWRQGQIVFVQTPLAEVVAQINRYRPGRVLVTDERLQSWPITAVFNLNKLDDAVLALEQTLGLQARRIADYWVLLG